MMRWENGPPPCVDCGQPGFKVGFSDSLVRCGKHAAETEAADAVRKANHATLLRTFAALTHQMHEAARFTGTGRGVWTEQRQHQRDLRSRRDRVEREILRRMT